MSNLNRKLRVIGIKASPRDDSISASLLKVSLMVLNEKGIDTKIVNLWNYRVLPCTGCGHCHTKHECVIKDDHSIIIDELKETDAIIFASGVYFYGLPSHSKLLLTVFNHIGKTL
jgi:multimeric flavodoxin WrbA